MGDFLQYDLWFRFPICTSLIRKPESLFSSPAHISSHNTKIGMKVDSSYQKKQKVSWWKAHKRVHGKWIEMFWCSWRSVNQKRVNVLEHTVNKVPPLQYVHLHLRSSDWQGSPWVSKHLNLFSMCSFMCLSSRNLLIFL